MAEPVTVKKATNWPKVLGGVMLMLGVPVTCVVGGIAENVAISGASLALFIIGLVLFVVGRMKD